MFFVQFDEFVHDEMLPLVFFRWSLRKKKTRELSGYSLARWKWNIQEEGSLGKFSVFQKFQVFSKNYIARKLHFNIISGNDCREVGSTSLPGGNQVDGLPPASSCNFGCFFGWVVEFVHLLFALSIFSHEVHRKRKLGSYSAIHFLDESEMSRTQEILEN